MRVLAFYGARFSGCHRIDPRFEAGLHGRQSCPEIFPINP